MLVAHAAGLAPFTLFGTKSAEQIHEEAGWFCYDTLLCRVPEQLAALQGIPRPRRVLFGCDFPNALVGAIKGFTAMLDGSSVFSNWNKAAVEGR